MSETRRIFIAVPLMGQGMANVHAAYERQARTVIEEHSPHAIWKPEQAGSHVTLRFVGDVPAGETLELLYDLVRDAVGQHPPFIIALGGKAVWQTDERLVLWVGVGGQETHLAALAHDVSAAVVGAGYQSLRYDFVGHFTIGRVTVPNPATAELIGQRWSEHPDPAGAGVPYMVKEAGMYASEIMLNGSIVYVRVGQPMRLDPALLS